MYNQKQIIMQKKIFSMPLESRSENDTTHALSTTNLYIFYKILNVNSVRQSYFSRKRATR